MQFIKHCLTMIIIKILKTNENISFVLKIVELFNNISTILYGAKILHRADQIPIRS